MPTRAARLTHTTVTVANAVSSAFSDAQTLRDEVQEVVDALEDNFSGTQRYQTLSEAVDALDSCDSEPDVPAACAELTLEVPVYTYGRRGPSRAQRRDDVTAVLSTVVSFLSDREWPDDALPDDVQELVDELENAASEWDSAEFPGMRG